MFFRYLPDNIVDVSSLSIKIEELTKAGIKNFVLIDAGFFSEDKIKERYEKGIDFLTRLPSSIEKLDFQRVLLLRFSIIQIEKPFKFFPEKFSAFFAA